MFGFTTPIPINWVLIIIMQLNCVEHHAGSSGGANLCLNTYSVLVRTGSVDAVAPILSMLRKDIFMQRLRDPNY